MIETCKKKNALLMKNLLIVALLLLAAVSFCVADDTDYSGSSTVEKVEVYHFHPTNGCRTCTTIGEYAEELVNTSYQTELENKKIIFDHINFQDPKNADLVEKYEVTGSSLMIGVYDADGFHKEENIKVWYKTDDKDEFMTYLKELLDKRLAGDLSD